MIDPVAVRRHILNMCYHSNLGHLSPSLSVVEILASLYGGVMDRDKIKAGAPDRDRFFASKGHCAPALYGVLAECGLLERSHLDGYASDGSALAGLVSHAVRGVELSTGAVGHGINVAVGCALGLRNTYPEARVYVLVGDAELQEGGVWEAMWLAAHHELSNLYVLVDNNRIGSVGFTSKVAHTDSMLRALQTLGCSFDRVDGHSVAEITSALLRYRQGNRPKIIECQTIKGAGISFMENEGALYHYKTLTAETYAKAMAELSPDCVPVGA